MTAADVSDMPTGVLLISRQSAHVLCGTNRPPIYPGTWFLRYGTYSWHIRGVKCMCGASQFKLSLIGCGLCCGIGLHCLCVQLEKLKQERDATRIKAQEEALERQYSRWKVPTQLRTSQQIRSNPEAREAAYARHALHTSLAQVRCSLVLPSYRAQNA